jgi:hypothetical protein
MKRFIMTVLCASVFFVGLGAIAEKAGAKFKSDEKALALIRAARVAIGGDSSIAGVQSLRIVGQTTQTFRINGTDQTEQGETEIALQLPDKLMKTVKIGHGDGTGEQQNMITRQMDVVVVGNDENGKTIVRGDGKGEGTGSGAMRIIVKEDGEPNEEASGDGSVKEINTADGKKIIVHKAEGTENFEFRTANPSGAPLDSNGKQTFFRTGGHGEARENELLRLTLGLFLSAPQGIDVNYTYGGESDVDGTACNLVVADLGGLSIKLFLNRDSNLPVMMAYTGMRMPKVITFNKEVAPPADGSKDVIYFKNAGPGVPAGGDKAEFQVRFSDYRSVNGVQLPYRWTTNVNGSVEETFDVENYEVNPANIAEKFQHEKVFVRMKKPDGQ